MTGQGQHIYIISLYVDRHLADTLNGIGMEGDLVFPRNLANLLDRKDDARLIIGQHDGDKHRLRLDGAP